MAHELELKWSRRALSDLERLLDYVALDKPSAARQLAGKIRGQAENLRSYPNLGCESLAGLRELVIHRHYLLTYRVKPGRIEIIQVWHTAQKR
jgi:toxin ParE1/3/4